MECAGAYVETDKRESDAAHPLLPLPVPQFAS